MYLIQNFFQFRNDLAKLSINTEWNKTLRFTLGDIVKILCSRQPFSKMYLIIWWLNKFWVHYLFSCQCYISTNNLVITFELKEQFFGSNKLIVHIGLSAGGFHLIDTDVPNHLLTDDISSEFVWLRKKN